MTPDPHRRARQYLARIRTHGPVRPVADDTHDAQDARIYDRVTCERCGLSPSGDPARLAAFFEHHPALCSGTRLLEQALAGAAPPLPDDALDDTEPMAVPQDPEAAARPAV